MKKQRILLTGANGFIGSHLTKRLLDVGATVHTPVLDVLDLPGLLNYMGTHHITTCIHLAGRNTVEEGYTAPGKTFQTNIQGTINILDCARALQLERTIIASTVHVYGSQEGMCHETSPLFPTRPYETSKACADMIAQSYASTFNIPVLIPRFVNTYGPGDHHHERLIPRTIHSLLLKKTENLWGGSIKRDYLFIDDAIEAYVSLLMVDMATIGSNPIFNIGTGHLTPVQTVMNMIAESLELDPPLLQSPLERPKEHQIQHISFEKAHTMLGWSSKLSLAEGLQKTIPWYVDQFKVRAKA